MTLAKGMALIFDMDGVIVDSMPAHTEAWQVYLHRLGIECPDLERRMHGRRNDEIVADFIGSDLPPDRVFQHGAAKEVLYRKLMAAQLESRLVPGIREFLEDFQSVPMGVASNAEPANVDFVLDRANLRPYFQVIVDGMQVENPKPHPDVYLKAADELMVHAGDCIILEDSPAGVEAARRAGARVIGVETHSPLEGVDLRIRDFLDPSLRPWLSKQVRHN